MTRSVSYTTRSLLANRTMVFDNLRRSFDELISRATKPEERRAIAARASFCSRRLIVVCTR